MNWNTIKNVIIREIYESNHNYYLLSFLLFIVFFILHDIYQILITLVTKNEIIKQQNKTKKNEN